MASGLCGFHIASGTCCRESGAWGNGPSGRMMSPDLRVLGKSDGLPALPDTEYLLCHNTSSNNELAKVVFEAMENYHNPWQFEHVTSEGGDDSLIVEGDFE